MYLINILRRLIPLVLVSFLVLPANAAYTVNVVLSTSIANPSVFQQDLISNLTTGQYIGKVMPSFFFPNTYSLTITGKNPIYMQPPLPAISTEIINLDTISKRMVDVSTWSYVYGFSNGMDYERVVDMSRISTYIVNCSSANYFGVGATGWSEPVCTSALMAVEQDIYNLKFSTPTLVPPLPIIFQTTPSTTIIVSTGPVTNVVLKSATTPDCYQLKVQPNGTVFTTYVNCPK